MKILLPSPFLHLTFGAIGNNSISERRYLFHRMLIPTEMLFQTPSIISKIDSLPPHSKMIIIIIIIIIMIIERLE